MTDITPEQAKKLGVYQFAMNAIWASPHFGDITKSRNPDKDYFKVPISINYRAGERLLANVVITIREVLAAVQQTK